MADDHPKISAGRPILGFLAATASGAACRRGGTVRWGVFLVGGMQARTCKGAARLMNIAFGLCVALPLLASRVAIAEESVIAVDTECMSGRPQIDRSWLVFFDRDSSTLNERGKETARSLALVFQQNHGTLVIAYGHVDGAEQASSDRNLGLRRADAVAAVLAEEGIQVRRIFTKDVAFSAPLIPEAVGVSEVQNRFVSLTPIGVDEGHETFVARCKAAIQKSCFGPISGNQRKRCDAALDVLAPPG